jgi:hypothetical protein
MDKSLFRVVDNPSAGQEIPLLLGDSKMFIVMFRGADHWTLSWTSRNHSILPHTVSSDSIHPLICANISQSFIALLVCVFDLHGSATFPFQSLPPKPPHFRYKATEIWACTKAWCKSAKDSFEAASGKQRKSWAKPQHKTGKSLRSAAI